jgi:17beta-estradiol 17-dehydrogenase / very-long-chain 3-oxoacyl-CoA reductase
VKLDECSKELKQKYPSVNVLVIDIDFSKFDEKDRKRVHDILDTIDVGVLVNNVGVSYPFPKYFHELDDERVEHLISLNVNSTTWMTRIVLPGMIKRKRGAIVNISSAAGVSISPLLSQYGASKSYIAMFSKALNAELKSKGIHVQCQVPLYVTTKLAKLRKTSLMVPSTSGYARAAVNAMGTDALVSPYWSHALQFWIMDCVPEWLLTSFVMNMHLDIRKIALKKEAKAAEAAGKEKSN